MFGEMVGVGIADLWLRAGKPALRYIERGPGRGTLALDALRTMARFGAMPQGLHLIETSPALRAAQAARLPAAVHHDDIADLPGDVAPIIVANEFFDALPIHQYVRTAEGWRERVVMRDQDALAAAAGDTPAAEAVPPALRQDRKSTRLNSSH